MTSSQSRGAKIGDTLRLRDAVEFTVGKNPDITSAIQDVVETQKTLTLKSSRPSSRSNFSSAELTLSIDAFSDRYLKSAAVALANQVDVDGLTMAYQSTRQPGRHAGHAHCLSLIRSGSRAETLDTFSAPMDGKPDDVYQPQSPDRRTEGRARTVPVQQPGEAAVRARPRMGTMGGFGVGHGSKRQNPHRRPARRRSAGQARPARRVRHWR